METLFAVLIFICVAGVLRYAFEACIWKDERVNKK